MNSSMTNQIHQVSAQQQYQFYNPIQQTSMMMDKPEEQYLYQKTNQTDYSALDTNLKLIQDMLNQPLQNTNNHSTYQSANAFGNQKSSVSSSQQFNGQMRQMNGIHDNQLMVDQQNNNNMIQTHMQYPCDYIFQQEEPPVEYRLMQFNEIYKNRKQEAQMQYNQQLYGSVEGSVHNSQNNFSQYLSNKQQNNNQPPITFQPQINPLSDRIVSSLENRVGKVQDRLYDQHKKQQAIKSQMQSQIVKDAKENAKPQISQKSKQMMSQKSSTNEPIEERLISFKKRIEGKKHQLEDKYKEQCTFKPQINEHSKVKSGYINRPKDLLYQPLKKQSLQVNNESDGSNFRPNLNKKTLEIIEKKCEGMSVYDRLTQSVERLTDSTNLASDHQLTFVPQINPISDELDNRMKMGFRDDTLGFGAGKERWQTLYELGLKKKEDMEILRKNYQEMKELEEKSCTFKPQIYSKGTIYDPSTRMGGDSCGNKVSIFDRSKAWAENKLKKIEILKEQYVDKDIDECTFQPALNNHDLKSLKNHRRQISVDSIRNHQVDEVDQESSDDYQQRQLDEYQKLQQSQNYYNKITEVVQEKNAKSVERFVNRLQNVRQQKIEQIEEQKKQIGSGNLWKNQITVPKEPKFNKRNETNRSSTLSNNNNGYQSARVNSVSRGYGGAARTSQNLSQLIDQFGQKSVKNIETKNKTSFSSGLDQSQISQSTTNKFKRNNTLREDGSMIKNEPVKFEANMEFDSCLSLLHQHIQSLDI